VTAGATYYYTLEDLDISGASSLHGPVSVVFQAPTAVTLGSLAANPAGIPATLPLGAASAAVGLAALLVAAWQRQRSR
jgi:hypothetical protein